MTHHLERRAPIFFVDFENRRIKMLVLKNGVSNVNNFENRGGGDQN